MEKQEHYPGFAERCAQRTLNALIDIKGFNISQNPSEEYSRAIDFAIRLAEADLEYFKEIKL